jgi:hypothetical protein
MMDRRTTIKWVLAAGAAWPLGSHRLARAVAGEVPRAAQPTLSERTVRGGAPTEGYGTDPDLMRLYAAGELWPLSMTPAQRQLAGVLADLIIPADERSAGAAAVGAVDFIDEWISAPYPAHVRDREIVLPGFAWLDAAAGRHVSASFVDLAPLEQTRICDTICDASRAAPDLAAAARFFALYRDLTAGAFYTTPVGRKDLGYIGNVPLARFDGPPPDLLKSLGLA